MSTQDKLENQSGRITLDLELKDLIGAVSKSTRSPISTSDHFVEGEALRKAWFNHMLLSVEKLSDSIEKIRREDIIELKKELRSEINKIDLELKSEIVRVRSKMEQTETDLSLYKRDVVSPLNDRLLVIGTKLGVWGVLAGAVGSGVFALIAWILKELATKVVGD